MLDKLRAHGGGWGAKVGLGAIALVFIFWGYGASNNSTGGTWAAKVNGKEISLDTYERAYRATENQMRQRSKGEISPRFVAQQVLDDLIERELLSQFAKEAGLAASPAQIADYITTTDMVDEQTGKFIGKQKYLDRLKEWGTTVDDYEESTGKMLTIARGREYLENMVKVTPAEVKEEFRSRMEMVNLSFLTIDKVTLANSMKSIPVKQEEIDAWTAANPGKVETIYAEAKDSEYTTPAKVELLQITVRKPSMTRKDAADDLAAAKRRSDRALEAATAEWKTAAEQYSEGAPWEKTGVAREFARRDLPAAVADAAFAMKPDDPAKMIETPTSFVIAKVKSLSPETVTELDEPLKKKIVEAQIREVKAPAEVESFAADAMARVKKGEAIEKIAALKGLAVKETGKFPMRDEIPGVQGADAALVAAAFKLSKPGEALELPGGGVPKVGQENDAYMVAVLKEHIQASDDDFEKQKGWIEGSLKRQRGQELFSAWKSERLLKAKVVENPQLIPKTTS